MSGATARSSPIAALWESCSGPIECGLSILFVLKPYLVTYLGVIAGLILASLVLHKLLNIFDAVTYWIYERRLRHGSLKRKTRLAQWYYLASKCLRRLRVFSILEFGYAPDEFQQFKARGLAEITGSVVQLAFFPFRRSASNLFTWSVVLIIMRPSLPTVAETKTAINYAWNTDWGKLLPWLALVLLLMAYHRMFVARVRLRFRERNADRAFELSVGLANALSSIQDATDRNISMLLDDLESGRLLGLWCSEVTGHDIWSVEDFRVSVERGPNLLPANLHYCLYRSAKQADLRKVVEIVRSMEEERLWPFWSQLWPRITFELFELRLRRYINPELCFERFLDAGRIRSIVQANAKACVKRLESTIDKAKDDLAYIETPAWMINRDRETPAVLELSRQLSAELRSFSQLMHRTIGQSIYASICADRVIDEVLSYGHSSRIERALLWLSK